VIAAILFSVPTAHQHTSAADVAVGDTYHACLTALQHHGDVPAGAHWSAAEARRLANDDDRKP
jgi:hypothetical protein